MPAKAIPDLPPWETPQAIPDCPPWETEPVAGQQALLDVTPPAPAVEPMPPPIRSAADVLHESVRFDPAKVEALIKASSWGRAADHSAQAGLFTAADLEPDPLTGQIEPELPAIQKMKGEPTVIQTEPQPGSEFHGRRVIHPAVIDPAPAVAPLQAQAEVLVREFMALTVQDQAGLDAAGDLRKRAKKLRDQIEATRKSWTDPLRYLVERLMNQFRGPVEFLDKLAQQIDEKILAYHRQAKAIQEEAARKAREAAAAAAIEAAEKARADAEAMRQALPGEQGQAVAAMIERAGQKEVQAIQTAPVYVPPPPRPAAGATVRKTWTYEVTDIQALCRAVAAGEVPANFVQVNGPIITAEIRQGKRQVPGLRIYQQEGVSGR